MFTVDIKKTEVGKIPHNPSSGSNSICTAIVWLWLHVKQYPPRMLHLSSPYPTLLLYLPHLHTSVCCSATYYCVHTQGSILRFDCTFDLDDVVEEMEVDQSFRIQSVSVIPKHANGNSDSVYAADVSNLDEVRGEVYVQYPGLTLILCMNHSAQVCVFGTLQCCMAMKLCL